MAEKTDGTGHYVSNKDMLKELRKMTYWKDIEATRGKNKLLTLMVSISAEYGYEYLQDVMITSGAVSEKLGEYILSMVNRIATKPCYMNYSFKNDMIGDALYIMTKYANRFNPDKSSNAFAYFSKIAHRAFHSRIHKEEASRDAVKNYQEKMYPDLMKEMADGNFHGNFDGPSDMVHEMDTLINEGELA